MVPACETLSRAQLGCAQTSDPQEPGLFALFRAVKLLVTCDAVMLAGKLSLLLIPKPCQLLSYFKMSPLSTPLASGFRPLSPCWLSPSFLPREAGRLLSLGLHVGPPAFRRPPVTAPTLPALWAQPCCWVPQQGHSHLGLRCAPAASTSLYGLDCPQWVDYPGLSGGGVVSSRGSLLEKGDVVMEERGSVQETRRWDAAGFKDAERGHEPRHAGASRSWKRQETKSPLEHL